MIGHRNNDFFKYCSCVYQKAHWHGYLQAEKRILSVTMSVISRAVFIHVKVTKNNSDMCVFPYTKK